MTSRVMAAISRKLAAQQAVEFVGSAEVDTTRCVPPPSSDSSVRSEEIRFGIVELLQNMSDFVADLICLQGVKQEFRNVAEQDEEDETIQATWSLDGDVFMQLTLDDRGIRMEQVGRPLSLDCIGSGTLSKAGSETNAGGFGDGSKTGFKGLLRNGYSCAYEFCGYNGSSSLRWTWSAKIFPDYTEAHMGVSVTTSSTHRRPRFPLMTTRVGWDGLGRAQRFELVDALIHAMGRFPCLFFVRRPDPLSVGVEGGGSWFASSCFESMVPGFMRRDVYIPRGANVLVAGILYPFDGPDGLIVEVPGRGLPGDTYAVFNNHFRDVALPRLQEVVRRQLVQFAGDPRCETAFASAFWPLLHGGNSLMCTNGRCTLVGDDYKDKECIGLVKSALLFAAMAPAKWSKTREAAQRARARKKAERALLVYGSLVEKARYCQFLRGASPSAVVELDLEKTNWRFFPATSEPDLNTLAVQGALSDARGEKKRAELVDPALAPAIQYISDDACTRVVRVFGDPGLCKIFDLRADNTVVYWMKTFDGEKTLHAICPYLGETVDDRVRAMRFMLHFVNVKVAGLARRVDLAIQGCTKEPEPRETNESKRTQVCESKRKRRRSDAPAAEKVVRSQNDREVAPSVLRRSDYSLSDGVCTSRRRPEPKNSRGPDLVWNAEARIFAAKGAPSDPIARSDLIEPMAAFERALELARAAGCSGRCQIFPAFSPNADWSGLHFSDGDCLINLAFVKRRADILTTMLHEIAHEESPHHDFYHGKEVQSLTTRVFEKLMC